MSALWFDLKLALRSLARSPGYTVVSMVALALGIGASVFVFSSIKGFMLTPLPFPDSDELVHVGARDAGSVQVDYPLPARYLDEWRRDQRVMEDIAGYYVGTVNLSGDERPERYSGAFVTANLFDVLRVQPRLGRTFRPGDDRYGEPLVVLIGEQLWLNRFNADPGIVGARVRINGEDAEIVGVMPSGFHFPMNEDIWLPARQDLSTPDAREAAVAMVAFGRLPRGTSETAARAALQALHDAKLTEFGDDRTAAEVVVKPLAHAHFSQETRSVLLTLFASAILVLLIACSNVANLTLARVAARRREIAVRASLGARRARLIGGLLAEVSLVSLAGAALGVALSEWGGVHIDAALVAAEAYVPYWVDWSLDWKIISFAVAAALASALLAGFLPAWRASRADLNSGLRDGGYGSSDARQGRLSRVLVTFQIALCTVLLISTGLMLRSAHNMHSMDDGLAHRDALTGRIGLFESAHPDGAARLRVYERVQEEFAALPGVRAATVATALPLTGTPSTRYLPDGAEIAPGERRPSARISMVLPNYFDTFGIPVRSGRAFTAGDRADSAPVALVNAAFAEREWPGRDAVGQRVQVDGDDGEWVTVVGIVGNFVTSSTDFYTGIQPAIFRPLAQTSPRFVSFAVAVDGDPNRLRADVRDAMLRVDADTPIYWLRTFDDVSAMAMFDQRLVAVLFAVIGTIATILTVTGLYAVLAYAVGQRTREIGVRRALGAQDNSIVRMVVGQGWRQYLVGTAVGLAVAVLFAQLLQAILIGVRSYDPVTFAGVVVMLGALALVSAWVPTQRALKVQPMVALRQD